MRPALLDLLRCPFCGGALSAGHHPPDPIEHAVLSCACGAYPVVRGVPVLRIGDEVTAAIHAIERDDLLEAGRAVLDLPAARHPAFEAALGPGPNTFADAVRQVLPDGEGDYCALRFGDPTFVAADAVVRAIARRVPEATGPLLDVCGGCGHLTWTLTQVAAERGWPDPVLIDASFWRLLFAHRFLVPDADLVCADVNQPLPLASAAVTLAVCNDAAHYVWSKRTLSTDMLRVAGPKGWVAWTHVHAAPDANRTAGHTLTPAHYGSLFGRRTVLAAADHAIVQAVMAGYALPWEAPEAPGVAGAGALSLVAVPRGGDLMLPPHQPALERGPVVRNPCYAERRDGDRVIWEIALPSPEYEAEFGALREYLPARLEWPAAEVADLASLARTRLDLLLRRVLLQVPDHYL